MEIPWVAMGREVLVVLLEFLFFISERCQVMHYLTHTLTHTGCYTSTRLLHIYYLKILSHDDTDISFYHFAPCLGRNGLVFSTKGHHIISAGGKKHSDNLLLCTCTPGTLSPNNTQRTQTYLKLHPQSVYNPPVFK